MATEPDDSAILVLTPLLLLSTMSLAGQRDNQYVNEGQVEWRGKVQQVESGEAYYFREWAALIEAFQQMLPVAESEPGNE